jgi:hypothetical protein
MDTLTAPRDAAMRLIPKGRDRNLIRALKGDENFTRVPSVTVK